MKFLVRANLIFSLKFSERTAYGKIDKQICNEDKEIRSPKAVLLISFRRNELCLAIQSKILKKNVKDLNLLIK